MDTKALRQKILDLAIRGRLVPQDPADEPASVLLERIRAEKQQMVKDGKLKAKDIKNDTVIYVGEDNLHYEKFSDGTEKCIEDEIPFEIPDGWAWSRLGGISTTIQYGLSNSAEDVGTHRLLRITDIQNGRVEWDKVPFTSVNDPENYLLATNDIVFARTGATVGKSFLLKELPYAAVYASYLIRIRLTTGLLPEYLYQFFNSRNYWDQITNRAVGVGQPNCNGTSLRELFIPIPPINEQGRIVPKATSLLRLAEIVDEKQSSVSSLAEQVKARVLDLAIRGKLVPQDPADEPASVLLERIRSDKEEQIKAGKIKRDKKESFIFRGEDNSYYEKIGDEVRCIDDQLPYVIPENWAWTRLSSISIINPKQTLDENLLVSFVPMPLIEDGYRSNNTSEVRKWKEVRTGYTHFADGDIGVAKITPCFENRKSLVFHGLTNGYGAGTTELFIIRCNNRLVVPEYLLWLMKTKAFIDGGVQTFSSAVGQQRVSKEYIESTFIPLPPVREQKNICSKTVSLLGVIETLEQSLK